MCPNPKCRHRAIVIDEVAHDRPWTIFDKDDLPMFGSISYCPFCGISLDSIRARAEQQPEAKP